MGIFKKFFQIRDQEVNLDLFLCGDFGFCEISFLAIFRGFVWELAIFEAEIMGCRIRILQKCFRIRDHRIKNYPSIGGDFWISQIAILVFF